jgi:hypothetical protein
MRKPRQLGRAAFCSNDGLNLIEPLKPVRGFCLGFGLAERRMIVTSRRQLVQLIVADFTPESDIPFASGVNHAAGFKGLLGVATGS